MKVIDCLDRLVVVMDGRFRQKEESKKGHHVVRWGRFDYGSGPEERAETTFQRIGDPAEAVSRHDNQSTRSAEIGMSRYASILRLEVPEGANAIFLGNTDVEKIPEEHSYDLKQVIEFGTTSVKGDRLNNAKVRRYNLGY